MKEKGNARPKIETISRAAELRRWYWLKSELVAESKRLGIKSTGAKFTILERLCHYYESGDPLWPGEKTTTSRSKFDWHSSKLTAETVITDNYKNTQNVRRFFQNNVDPKFKFNISLMEWIQRSAGKTLGDAAEYWQQQKSKNAKTKIKPHNQFNQYIRDFMADNPSLGIGDARRIWAVKKQRPSESGRHHYERSDLEL